MLIASHGPAAQRKYFKPKVLIESAIFRNLCDNCDVSRYARILAPSKCALCCGTTEYKLKMRLVELISILESSEETEFRCEANAQSCAGVVSVRIEKAIRFKVSYGEARGLCNLK